MVPPDGGWGWLVVLGCLMINLCVRPIISSFGLLFGDMLKELEIETTGVSLIVGIYDLFFQISAVLTTPLSRYFSYRLICVTGGIVCSLGLTLAFKAQSMAYLMFSFSILHGLGGSLATTASFVGLNHYFKKRIGLAIGLSISGTSIGMIFLPQIVRFLLESYGFRGAILITGGIVLNVVVGACLLQPVEWHSNNKALEDSATEDVNQNNDREKLLVVPNAPIEFDLGKQLAKQEFCGTKTVSIESLPTSLEKISSVTNYTLISNMDFSRSSLHFNFQKAIGALEILSSKENSMIKTRIIHSSTPALTANKSEEQHTQQFQALLKSTSKPYVVPRRKTQTQWRRFVDFFGFGVLKDPVFLNLVFGLSMFFVGDQFFLIVLPFYLKSVGSSNKEVAYYLSLHATAEMVARLTFPAICDRIPMRKRTLFMVVLICMGLSRSVYAHQTTTTFIIICFIASGFLRGLCIINYLLAIAEYATLEKLSAAYGLNMAIRGVLSMGIGTLLGYIRDVTKSYQLCIHLQTCLFLLSGCTWGIEYLIDRHKNSKRLTRS